MALETLKGIKKIGSEEVVVMGDKVFLVVVYTYPRVKVTLIETKIDKIYKSGKVSLVDRVGKVYIEALHRTKASALRSRKKYTTQRIKVLKRNIKEQESILKKIAKLSAKK